MVTKVMDLPIHTQAQEDTLYACDGIAFARTTYARARPSLRLYPSCSIRFYARSAPYLPSMAIRGKLISTYRGLPNIADLRLVDATLMASRKCFILRGVIYHVGTL